MIQRSTTPKQTITRHGWIETQSTHEDLTEEEGASAMKREDCQNTFEGTKEETLEGKRGMELEEDTGVEVIDDDDTDRQDR